MRSSVLLVVALAEVSVTASGQPLSVSVFEIDSRRPVPEATVQILGEHGPVQESETDSDGEVAFSEIPPGSYRLLIEKPGYADLLDPGKQGRTVILTSNQTLAAALSRTAVISGEVTDFEGKPLQGGIVTALVRRSVNGVQRLVPFGQVDRSDDRGVYRLHGLAPGRYSVAVFWPNGDTVTKAFAPAYYGSTGSGEAVFFALQPGEVRSSVNLTIAESRLSSISGKVSGIPADVNPRRAAVALVSKGGFRVPMATTLTDAEAAFAIPDVPSGEYQLIAWSPFAGWGTARPPETHSRFAAQSISISGTDLQSDMELRPLVEISGTLVRDDPACTNTGQIVFHSEDSWLGVWSPEVVVNGEGFTARLPQGRHRVEMPGLGASCRLAAVRVGDKLAVAGSVLIEESVPLMLVLSASTGDITGLVTTPEDEAAAGVVLLSPVDRNGPPEMAQLDAEGRYRLNGVLTGEYRLTALPRLTSTDYLDPVEMSDRRSKRVVVEDGRETTSNLRLIPE